MDKKFEFDDNGFYSDWHVGERKPEKADDKMKEINNEAKSDSEISHENKKEDATARVDNINEMDKEH